MTVVGAWEDCILLYCKRIQGTLRDRCLENWPPATFKPKEAKGDLSTPYEVSGIEKKRVKLIQ